MEPFIGLIVQFGGNFAPRGWALCNGQLLAISSHSALFSILGTTYGGDGVSTFGLPDLRGRVAIHEGTGPGLSHYSLGQKSGQETVTLTVNQMPSHRHDINVVTGNANANTTSGNVLASSVDRIYSSESPDGQLNSAAVSNTGANQPVKIIQPYLAVNFIIALEGLYPSRS